jgi:hypothetical protein
MKSVIFLGMVIFVVTACSFDVSGLDPVGNNTNNNNSNPVCGDGIVNQVDEQCDGTDFNNDSCSVRGF